MISFNQIAWEIQIIASMEISNAAILPMTQCLIRAINRNITSQVISWSKTLKWETCLTSTLGANLRHAKTRPWNNKRRKWTSSSISRMGSINWSVVTRAGTRRNSNILYHQTKNTWLEINLEWISKLIFTAKTRCHLWDNLNCQRSTMPKKWSYPRSLWVLRIDCNKKARENLRIISQGVEDLDREEIVVNITTISP